MRAAGLSKIERGETGLDSLIDGIWKAAMKIGQRHERVKKYFSTRAAGALLA
jgi:hypothetical protein